VRIIFLALLFANIRGNWLSTRWLKAARIDIVPARQSATISDKLADQLPTFLWPKVRFIFYLMAAVEIGGLFLALAGPRG
jgi:drug/metabolite transporter superfamily protein YnfA